MLKFPETHGTLVNNITILIIKDDKPFLHGRALQTPGLAYLPNLDYSNYSDWITTHHRDIDPSTAFVYKRYVVLVSGSRTSSI